MRKKQFEALMRRLDRIEAVLKALHEEVEARVQPAASDEKDASTLLQAGIDSIMSYQWPPQKGGNE